MQSEDLGFEKIFKISQQYGDEWLNYINMKEKGYRFRLGNNSGVDDQLDAVTSVAQKGTGKGDERLLIIH
ncbi:hypothetical protein BpHYR1_003211 [Brachionus plicatilis]|uniref:Uncharacterized protein n=1 Tax=Brachionus plicatilis TaxID=10195 RepID=A0A3M7SGJ2_BRAPC|nr:hypothetical protein BpHYR1_003211 [Brachionus plicatilis]